MAQIRNWYHSRYWSKKNCWTCSSRSQRTRIEAYQHKQDATLNKALRMKQDHRNRFNCSVCGNKVFVKYTHRISNKSREIVYECRHCNMNLKSIEEIYQIAKFKPLVWYPSTHRIEECRFYRQGFLQLKKGVWRWLMKLRTHC